MQEAEEGLLRLSDQHFDPKTHFFQEGQYIDKDTARAWLSRSSANEAGLNPPAKEGLTEEQACGRSAELSCTYRRTELSDHDG